MRCAATLAPPALNLARHAAPAPHCILAFKCCRLLHSPLVTWLSSHACSLWRLMNDKHAFLAAAWQSFWADPPPPPPQAPDSPDGISGRISGGIAALHPSSWLEALVSRLFQADPSKLRLRCNGMCCLSLPELMVVSLMSSSLLVTSADQRSASNPSELFALLTCLPAFDVSIFLTLQYLVSMGWRCCDGFKCADSSPPPVYFGPTALVPPPVYFVDTNFN